MKANLAGIHSLDTKMVGIRILEKTFFESLWKARWKGSLIEGDSEVISEAVNCLIYKFSVEIRLDLG
jgi:hypothetical protein